MVRNLLLAAATAPFVRVEGPCGLAIGGPAVVASNHVSFLDGFLAARVIATPMVFGITPAYCTGAWRHGLDLLKASGACVGWEPLSPDRPHGLRRLLRHLQAGRVVCIFPEGRIADNGHAVHKPGLQWLLWRSGAPLVSMWICGAGYSLLGRSRPRRLRPRVTVNVRGREAGAIEEGEPQCAA